MKDIIIKSINLDKFITYQNGSLLNIFYKNIDINNTDNRDNRDINDDNNYDTNDDSNIYKYKTTELYKTFDDTNENRKEFFIKSVNSYENFIKFLKSDTDIINYSYLWDIISSPNPLLFPLGLNLVIIELTNNDITDNVNIICPTNHYSSEFYDIDKKTLIILKNDDYYEPIYTYEDKKNKFEITRLFSLRDETILPTLTEIQPESRSKCSWWDTLGS